jgi:methylase of polypeptide subunit release factors
MSGVTPEIAALASLLEALGARGYRFITPTPATHARVIARKAHARDLRGMLGWSLPFERGGVDAEIETLLEACGALKPHGDLAVSTLRVSSLDDLLFLHSAYPTDAADAVFFGPDSYRFAAFIRAELPRLGPIHRLADIGAGTGVGAVAAMRTTAIANLILTDINPRALTLAQANMLVAGMNASSEAGFGILFAACAGLAEIDPPLDCIIANPPYIADPLHRAYRDGGAMHGGALSIAWAKEAAEKLAPGGAFLLYTGAAIVNGEDRLKAALHDAMPGFDIAYCEIDPDVFGEELERDDYAEVERIALIGAVAVKR